MHRQLNSCRQVVVIETKPNYRTLYPTNPLTLGQHKTASGQLASPQPLRTFALTHGGACSGSSHKQRSKPLFCLTGLSQRFQRSASVHISSSLLNRDSWTLSISMSSSITGISYDHVDRLDTEARRACVTGCCTSTRRWTISTPRRRSRGCRQLRGWCICACCWKDVMWTVLVLEGRYVDK